MKTIDFKLNDPLTYHVNGQQAETTAVTLRAPSNKSRKAAAALKQAYFQAALKIGQNAKTGEAKDNPADKADADSLSKADATIMVLSAYGDSLDVQLDYLKSLLVDGAALVDGDVKFTGIMFDNLSFDDATRMLGEYLSNFLT